MTHKTSLATSILWNWIARGVNIVISFILVRVLLLRLGMESYGVWVLVGSIIGYFNFLEFGIGSATVRYIARSKSSKDGQDATEYFSTSLIFFCAIAALTMLISLTLTFIPPTLFNVPMKLARPFRYLILLCGSAIAVSFIGSAFNALLRAYERFDRLNIISIIIHLTRLGAIMLLLDNSLIMLGAIQLAISCMHVLLTVVICLGLPDKIPFRFTAMRRATIRHIVHFGTWSFIILISDLIRFKTDAIVISCFIGVGSVTVFHIGHRLIDLIREVLGQMGSPFLPRFSTKREDDRDQTNEFFLKASRLTAFFSALAVGTAIGSGREFIKIWVGTAMTEVESSYLVLLIMILPAFLGIAQIISISYLYAAARHKLLALTTAFEAVSNIILSIILARIYGIYGVALGTALPMLVTKGIIQPYYTHLITGIPLRKYMQSCLLFPFLMIIPLAAGQMWLFHILPAYPAPIVLGLILASIAVYTPVVYMIYFTLEERTWFWRYIREWLKI